MDEIVFALAHGLIIGLMYSLSAIGVSVVAGLMKVVNFAHGEFYVLAGYLGHQLAYNLNLPIFWVVVLALAIPFALGVLVQLLFLQSFQVDRSSNLRVEDSLNSLVMTFVLSIIFQNVFLHLFGPFPQKAPPLFDSFFGQTGIEVGNATFGYQRVLIGVIAMVVFGIYAIWLRYSKLGICIRAASQDRAVARAFGVSTRKVNAIAFGISTLLAAVSGLLMAAVFPVTPTVGGAITLSASVIMVLGGVGSVLGCFVGGMTLGLMESFGGVFASSNYVPVFGFVLMIAVLIFRPQGIYGQKN